MPTNILVFEGDGIGAEIVAATRRVRDAANAALDLGLAFAARAAEPARDRTGIMTQRRKTFSETTRSHRRLSASRRKTQWQKPATS